METIGWAIYLAAVVHLAMHDNGKEKEAPVTTAVAFVVATLFLLGVGMMAYATVVGR